MSDSRNISDQDILREPGGLEAPDTELSDDLGRDQSRPPLDAPGDVEPERDSDDEGDEEDLSSLP
jgi:hypothetical protein